MRLIQLITFIGFIALLSSACQPTASSTADNSSSSTEEGAKTEQILERLSVTEFKDKMAGTSGQSYLIDVRTPEEFADGHIEGATNINYHDDNFLDQIAQLDKDATVFVYCQAGGRSKKASNLFKESGFKEIYDLKEGYGGWSE